jgi:protein MpaA
MPETLVMADQSPGSYAELVAAWKSLRGMQGASIREVACVGANRTLLVADLRNDPAAPLVAIAAGVHGDEPAGPWAILSLVRDGLLDRSFNYRCWPCNNPSGYVLGTRANAEGEDINRSFSRGGSTPEARAILTANRDRKFVLTLDLHEDFEAEGFYCYEPVIDDRAPYGAHVVRAVDDAGLPLQELRDDFDLGYPIEAVHLRGLERGRVLPNTAAEMAFFEGWPYSLALLRRAARRSLTFETPRMLPWDERLALHRIAVVTALAHVRAVMDGDEYISPANASEAR